HGSGNRHIRDRGEYAFSDRRSALRSRAIRVITPKGLTPPREKEAADRDDPPLRDAAATTRAWRAALALRSSAGHRLRARPPAGSHARLRRRPFPDRPWRDRASLPRRATGRRGPMALDLRTSSAVDQKLDRACRARWRQRGVPVAAPRPREQPSRPRPLPRRRTMASTSTQEATRYRRATAGPD